MAIDPTSDGKLLACTLPAAELALRRAEIQKLLKGAGSARAMPDGVLIKFPNTGEIAHALVDFIQFERQCCSDLTYELRSEPPHTELALWLHAPAALVSSVQSFYVEDKT